MRKNVIAVLLAMIIVAGAGQGSACTVLAPFEMSDILGAELVIVGEVTGYEPVENNWQAALVTVRVEEVLKGRARGELTFIWNGGLAQGPHESRAKGRVLIGAMKGGRIAVSDLTPDPRPDLPSIVQPYCGEVWMQSASPAVVEAARKALE